LRILLFNPPLEIVYRMSKGGRGVCRMGYLSETSTSLEIFLVC